MGYLDVDIFCLGMAIEQVFWEAVTNYSFLILGSPGIFVVLSFIVSTTLFITGIMAGITVTMLMKINNSG